MDNSNYITKEFYDSNMREFKEAVYASMAAAEARCERIAADMRVENEKMRSEYKNAQARIESRLDNIERSLDNFFKISGVVLTGMTLLFTMLQIFLR